MGANAQEIGAGISSLGTGAGQAIGGLIGGILTPFGSVANNLLGQTQTIETVDEGAAEASKKRTLTIVVAVIAVVTVVIIGIVLFKSAKS